MTLSPLQEQQLRSFMQIFLTENQKLNLSAYRTEETCWVGNILDSIPAFALLRSATAGRPASVLDVGTGGGFPLLPLALLLPELEFTGLDSVKKKIDAVQRIVNALDIKNAHLLVGRAEELGHEIEYREQYDIVLSRAVADLATLLEFCSPFVRIGGKVIVWKSMMIEEELTRSVAARIQLQCRLIERHRYNLDELGIGLPAVAQPQSDQEAHLRQGFGGQPPLRGGWGERQLLVFEKIKTLPREFPRRVGIPKKEPL